MKENEGTRTYRKKVIRKAEIKEMRKKSCMELIYYYYYHHVFFPNKWTL